MLKHLAKSGMGPSRLALLACLMLIIGCGGASEEAMEVAIESSASEEGKEVDVEIDSSTENGSTKISVQSEEGNVEIESSSSGDSGQETFKMTSTTDEGEMKMTAGDGATLPEDLPQDVPTFEGMKITFAQSMGGNAFNVNGITQSPVAEVADKLASSAKDQGWEEKNHINQTANGQEMRMIHFEKEKRTLQVMVVSSPEGTNINITTASGK